MSNHKMTLRLIAFCAAVLFFVGCIPEGSLTWSEDGSVGLLNIKNGLYLVDGETGELTELGVVAGSLPDISKDGKVIAYCEQVSCDNLFEGFRRLPSNQVRMIKSYAEQMRKNILAAGELTDDRYGFPEEGLLTPKDYRNWAIRYLVENADSELMNILDKEDIEKAKQRSISYFQIVVAPRENPAQRRVVTVSVFQILATQLSPDAKHVAYLMHTQEGEVNNAYEEYGLYIASVEGDTKAMYVDSRVAIGYDWRNDGQAIAYLNADSKDLLNDDLILGTLSEKVVMGAEGNLLAVPVDVPKSGSAGTHHCIGQKAELAGMAFYPWLKVEYGLDNRIFFSSLAMSMPVSKRDEAGCSLFCYDPVMGTVTDVLPLSVSSYTRQQIIGLSLFSLSPDGKRVLLPIMHNRFIVYELGTGSMDIPVPEEDGFGEEEIPELAPSWKGNREFSFLASEKSRLLYAGIKPREGQNGPDRREIIVMGKNPGKNSWRCRILSRDWPDEMTFGTKDGR